MPVDLPQSDELTKRLSHESADGEAASLNGDLIPQLKELAERVFDCAAVAIEVDFDPDCPEAQYYVFTVKTSGTPEQLVERQCRWHEGAAAIAPDSENLFRLSLDVSG